MNQNILVGDQCVVCENHINDDWKLILEKSTFTQTWCIGCVTNWILSYPRTRPEKVKAKKFLNDNGIKI